MMKMRKKSEDAPYDPDIESPDVNAPITKFRAAEKENQFPTSLTGLLGNEVYVLWAVSLFTRFLWYAAPGEVIFDEVHFGKFTNAYITGKHYFDIHPPLGKLLLYIGALFFGYNDKHPICTYENIGGNLHDCGYELLRIFPALWGSLIPPLMYVFARVLGGSRLAAVFVSLFVMFDNAFVVESRNVRMEPFIFTFVLLTGILSFTLTNCIQTQHNQQQQQQLQQQQPVDSASTPEEVLSPKSNSTAAEAAAEFERNKRRLYILTGFFLGCIMSVKWTPGAALCLCLAIQHFVLPIVRNQLSATIINSTSAASYTAARKPYSSSGSSYTRNFAAHFRTCFMYLFIIPISIYMLTFYIHFALLPYAGEGDGFMEPLFQSQLIGNPNYNEAMALRRPILYNPLFFFEYFLKLNKEMLMANFRTGGHSYDSRWYSWPLMLRGVFYWNKADEQGQRMIYLLGNPFMWWFSSLVLFFFAVLLACRYTRLSARIAQVPILNMALAKDKSALFMRAASVFMFFLVQWMPYIVIGRTTFLYHYMPALIFAYQLCGLQFDFWTKAVSTPKRVAIVVVLHVLFFISFLYFAPLTYGLNTDDTREKRFWVASWR